MKKILIPFIILGLLPGCAAMVAGTAATTTGVMVAKDRRSAGTMVDDKVIQMKSARAIYRATEHDPNTRISAISYNNRVLLVGEAPSYEMKNHVEQTIRQISKVKHVHNEIAVADPIPVRTQSTDSLITAKIKSEMAVKKDLNANRVKVITEDGVVYLMGLVNPKEETLAVDIARYTKGVKKVVKLFEYENNNA